MKSNTLIAVEWLWSHRGKNMWWTPRVLMEENTDPKAPKLTTIEAVSIFKYLQEKGLIFPSDRKGQQGFCLHESKIQEWNAFIEHLEKLDQNNLIAEKCKKNSGGNGSTNQSSGTDHHKKIKSGFFSADALEISGGLILFVFGGGFHLAGGWFHVIGFMFDFLVAWCGLTIITHHVETFKLFGLRYWLSLVMAFLIFVFLAAYVPLKENSRSLPPNAGESKPVETMKNSYVIFQQPIESGKTEWLPPELPEGCSNIIIIFGGHQIPYQISWAEGYPELFSEVDPENTEDPPSVLNNIQQIPITHSNIVRLGRSPMLFQIEDRLFRYPIEPYVKNNRLYIYVKIPFQANLHIVSMSDNWDSQIPPNWDRNFSSNVFEIVNDMTNPVLQVIYRRPNEVEINGLFISGTNFFWEAFGDKGGVYNVFINNPRPPSSGAQIRVYVNGPPTIFNDKITNIEQIFTKDFMLPFPSRKAIFKYPSWEYPGVLAE